MVNFIMSDPQLLKCVGIRKSNAPRGDRNERRMAASGLSICGNPFGLFDFHGESHEVSDEVRMRIVFPHQGHAFLCRERWK